MTWLSILVPVYNVAPYLEECLASVVEQLPEGGGVELLVLDDCSTDGSWALMQQLGERWPGRLRLLQHISRQTHFTLRAEFASIQPRRALGPGHRRWCGQLVFGTHHVRHHFAGGAAGGL